MYNLYQFELKQDGCINFRDEKNIVLHLKFKNNYLYVNCKSSLWLF